MSYRNYMPWARSIVSNDKSNNNKKSEDQSATEPTENKENTQDTGYRSRYGLGFSSVSSAATTSRTTDSSNSASNYRPGSYRASLTPSSYTARDRSVSGDRYTSTYVPKSSDTPSYSRTSYSRSNSTLSDRETGDSEKNNLTSGAAYSSYSRYGRSPSRTVSYDTLEEKPSSSVNNSPSPRTESSAFKYPSSSYSTNPISSRFLSNRKDSSSTEKLTNTEANTEGRYTYRTRPQPAVKKLEIPVKSKPEVVISPTSPLSPTLPPIPKKTEFRFEPEPVELQKNVPCTISVVTRGTSPNPPSSFLRTRRSDLAREIQRDVARPQVKPETKHQYTQTEKVEDTSRFSRYGSRTSTPWSSYLDRYPSASSTYSPVSRYSSKFASTNAATESPKSSTMASRPSRLNIDTISNKSTVTAADELKDSINSLVATLQTSPLGTPICEIGPKSEELVKNSNSFKLNKKEKSPEKIKTGKKSKSPEKNLSLRKSPEKVKSRSPEKLRKSISPEKCKSAEVKSESTIKKSPSKSDSRKSPTKTSEVVKVSRSTSKINLGTRRSSKDEISEKQAVNASNGSKSVPSSAGNSPKISHKVNNLSQDSSKTDINNIENLSPQLKAKVPIPKSVSKDKIDKSPSKTGIFSRQSSIERSNSQNNACDTITNNKEDSKESILEKSRCTIIKKLNQNEGIEKEALLHGATNEQTTTLLSECVSVKVEPDLIVEQVKRQNNSRAASPRSKIEINSRNNSPRNSLERSPATTRKSPPNSPETSLKSGQKLPLDTISKKLPPPSPKSTNLKLSFSLNALPKPKIANKDFRKSPLNMNNENKDLTGIKEKKAMSAGNSPLCPHKPLKSTSTNSVADISRSSVNSSSHCLDIKESKPDSFNNSMNLSSSHNLMSSESNLSLNQANNLNNSNKQSPENIQKGNDCLDNSSSINPNAIQPKFIRSSSSLRKNSSSTSSEEDEEEESEEDSSSEDKEQNKNDCENKTNLKDSGLCRVDNESCEKIPINLIKSSSFRRSRSHLLSRTDSGTSEDPCSSLPVDPIPVKEKSNFEKPPLPPSLKTKEESTSKAASFLMRALAPVTNLLFVKKPEVTDKETHDGILEDLKRSETFQSISEIHDEVISDVPNKEPVNDLEQWLDKNEKISTKFKKKKRAKSDTNEKVQCISTNSVDLHENLNKTNKQLAQSEVVHENKSIKEEKETNEIFKEAANTAPEKESVSAMSVDGSESVVMRSGSEQPSSKIWERPISCEVGWWLKDDEKLLQSENNKVNVNPCESIAEGSNQMSNSLSKNSMEQSNSPEIIGDKALNENEEGQIVRKVFRSESGEHSWLIDSTEDISDEDTDESEEDDSGSEIESDSEEEGNQELPEKERKQFQFRKIASGDRAWWMQSTDNVPEGISRIESSTSLNKNNLQEQLKYRLRPQISGDRAKWMVSNESVSDSLRRDLSKDSLSLSGSESRRRIKRIESGEKAWWMQSNENIPDEIQRNESTNSVSKGEEPVAIRYRIRPQQSGERSWWMQSTENIPEGVKRIESNSSLSKVPLGKRIRRIESGEKAWWMQSQDNVALNEGVKRNASIRSLTKHGEKGLKKSDSVRSNDSKLGRRVRRIESGEKAWWMDSNSDIPEGVKRIESSQSLNELKSTESRYKFKPLRPQVSGDRPWWLDSNANVPEGITRLSTSSEDSEEEESSDDEPDKQNFKKVPKFPLSLEERTSPDGLDANHGHKKRASGGRSSPYDNVGWISGEENGEELQDKTAQRKSKKNMKLFIGSHTNIDDILGKSEQPSAILSPIEVVRELTERFQMKEAGIARQVSKEQDDESEEETASEEEDEDNGEEENEVARATETATSEQLPRRDGSDVATALTLEDNPQETLDDASLQLYKDGDYGSYLDLEASLSEQHEEFEGFHLNRKNSIVLRTQLSVRVHTIIEKLLNSEGRELRRALFSLKQIFQEDKDLVHEFVQNDGLACLVKVGSGADQNFQNYILRALGQVMLYVDGMNGVMAHNETVQWLYALIASPFRLVVKTALKLLLVFVEYKESNCMLLIRAIHAEDKSKNKTAWSNVMKLLSDYDTLDTELLVYACSLINKTLNGLPDQDTYYDQVDALEEQGMEAIIQRYMSKQGTDLDLLRQFQIYEAVLHHEDGEEKGTPLRQLDEAFRKTLRSRKSSACDSPNERRKSRRHSSAVTPIIIGKGSLSNGSGPQLICSPLGGEEEGSSSSSRSSPSPSLGGDLHHLNGGSYGDNNKANAGVTPALRRRRERAERQRSFIREQQESAAILKKSSTDKTGDDEINNGEKDVENWQPGSNNTSRTPSRQDILMNAMNKMDSEIDSKDGIENVSDRIASFQKDQLERGELPERKILQLNRENTVKDLTQMLSNSNIVLSPSDDKVPRIGDMTGIISKAMEGLAKSKSKGDIKTSDSSSKIAEIKKSETELQWENLLENMSRPLTLCDLDFTDLNSDDELDILAPSFVNNGIPPPPPPISSMSPMMMPPPPPGLYTPPAPPGAFGSRYSSPYTSTPETPAQSDKILKKSKKTVKLFWKEVREDPAILDKLQKTGLRLIWDELSPVAIDTQKLEHLFESRAKDIAPKKQQEINKSKEIIVLDPKRSNAINIGMTKLPPPRSIKTAILKMDSTVMNREGIEKLFAMLPTEEERSRIQEAQVANPDIPLGSAEQFLLTLASITELPARLKLWAFKLDYENIEKEVAEPVMDLKQGMEILKLNKTFRNILGTLLSIGSFLNGNEVKGFQIEYLAKVPEVKDTVHKHSLLHHLCHMVMEKFPESTDLYSEIGAITRASKVDFDEISNNINRLESECKASWDHLKVIAKHDGSSATKNKMSDFLTDCAQRIILLGIIHRRVLNRFHNFLLCLGTPPHKIQETKPNEFCRILSEFALEYRTTRERVIQQLEKKANHRERNKTRGKMITEVGKFRTANKEVDRKDAELRQLLGGDMSEAESIGTWRRQRKDGGRMGSLRREEGLSEQYVDGDDELLESLVKTATKSPATRTTPRERKRTRHADLRRTLKNGLSEEEKKHLAAYIKGY